MSGIGLLFPGQGAQKVGMAMDLCEDFTSAAAVFDAACEAAQTDLRMLCLGGPLEELSRSDVAQPAILAASVAALRALQEACGPLPACAAGGLSLGEYSALVAAEALDFQEAVRLVQRRGRYMQEACEAAPGTMYSVIGLVDNAVEEACRTASETEDPGVWPANYNSPGQVVISGGASAAASAAALCTEAGAKKVIELNVAGAFHTPLMQSAADQLAGDLADVDLKAPAFPVVCNVTGELHGGPDEIRLQLARQVTHPVRWVACVRTLTGAGVARFLEVGPGRVLKGLLRRIDDSCVCESIGGTVEVRAYAEGLSGKGE